MPEELIISDASPLIALIDIEQVALLRQMYRRVIVTDVVRNEYTQTYLTGLKFLMVTTFSGTSYSV